MRLFLWLWGGCELRIHPVVCLDIASLARAHAGCGAFASIVARLAHLLAARHRHALSAIHAFGYVRGWRAAAAPPRRLFLKEGDRAARCDWGSHAYERAMARLRCSWSRAVAFAVDAAMLHATNASSRVGVKRDAEALDSQTPA